jgi:hypothetical protein
MDRALTNRPSSISVVESRSDRDSIEPLSNSEAVGVSLSPPSVAFMDAKVMEHLWSRAVATSGNGWQMARPRERLKQAQTVATGCDQLPIGAHGKGALPPWYGGGRLSGSARSAKSCEPEGSQDLTGRL